ncbi:D-alanine--D-alanine ligase [Mycobacterium sp. djl-10]|nr:D-alanine--D-alanine ligase [Mycobacterium sp. djl-10]
MLHLIGSPVDEFHAELSRLYARGCLQALEDPHRYEMHLAHVEPGGTWRFPRALSPAALSSAIPMSLSHAVAHIEQLEVDVVVPQMFCHPGMTAYRGLFDVLGIPYVGNTATVMGIAADKAKTRAIVAAAGVAVPAARVVRDHRPVDIPFPVVVKPVTTDNSVGVTLVRNRRQYSGAVDAALCHGDTALVEQYVELGREVRCGVVARDGSLIGLPLEEYAVDAVTKPIRDGADKLGRSADGQLYLVAKDRAHAWLVPEDDPLTDRVWAAARAAHQALSCRHYSLFDFRIDPHGNPWFLEAGLYCSFAPNSVIAVMAAGAGTGVGELFAGVLAELDQEVRTCMPSR